MHRIHKISITLALAILSIAGTTLGQASDDKALAITAKAVQLLGGERYLGVTSQVARGSFSQLRKEGVASYQTFTDAIIFPDKERTDFKGGGSRSIQVNTGDTGWIYDGDQDLVKVQTPVQIENFRRSSRASLDNLLRGYWKGQATLSYVGRRQATVGKRNDVVRLTYKDGFVVEFEFADDGTPVKALYQHKNAADEDVKEEDRYAQFVDVGGIKAPYIVDHYINGEVFSRINYDSVDFNRQISSGIFSKPASPKDARKNASY